mgnify:CR=1 FL=1
MSDLYSVRFTFELNEPKHPYKSKVKKRFEREIDFASLKLMKDIENFVFREGGLAKIKSFSQCKLSDDAQEVHVIIHPKKIKSNNQLNKSMKKLSHLKPKVIQDFTQTEILIAPTPITISSRKKTKKHP